MKNLKQTTLAILIGMSSLTVSGQSSSGALKGQILDGDNQPVFGATVFDRLRSKFRFCCRSTKS